MRLFGLFSVLVCTLSGALAFAGLTLQLESQLQALSGNGWSAHQINLLVRQNENPHLEIRIESLKISDFPFPLSEIELNCQDFLLQTDEVGCNNGQLRIARFQGKPLSSRVDFSYHRYDTLMDFRLTDLTLGGGRINIQGSWNKESWQLETDAVDLDLSVLTELLSPWFNELLEQGENSGRLTVQASLAGQGQTLERASFQSNSEALNLALGGGRYATQEFAFQLNGEWQSGLFKLNLTAFSGQAYLQPLFWEIATESEPVVAHVQGGWRKDRLELQSLMLHHPQVLHLYGSLTLGIAPVVELREADINVVEAIFPMAYSSYIQPFVGNLGGLQTEGRALGRLVLSEDEIQALELDLIDFQFEDSQGRFGASGMSGRLAWDTDSTPQRSSLYWREGHFYRLDLGAGGLALMSHEQTFQLLGQGRIPIFDGAIVIDQWEGQGLGTEDLSWRLDGMLTPVSMDILSEALDWPPLSGKLSGMVPDVHYADHLLEVGGALLINIFDGTITLTNLRLEDPLGNTPKVFVDVDLRNLDLLTLTQTFDFGRIEGKLGGRIEDLRLENWQPIHFDAVLATPEDDKTRHVISQRAVANISALGGGGPTVALSRGVISMFESFNYQRLGWRCHLQDGICTMGGIGSADGGYYLVKGKGLPRIDVIGYTRQVDWHELLTRLRTAIQSVQTEGVVIE